MAIDPVSAAHNALARSLHAAGRELHHTDEIVEPVDLDRDADLVAITCNTPAAAHAYRLARQLRARGRRLSS